jgi:hypothetical protein
MFDSRDEKTAPNIGQTEEEKKKDDIREKKTSKIRTISV